jgi:hypothetical protein
MSGSKQKKKTEGWTFMTWFPLPNIRSDDQIKKKTRRVRRVAGWVKKVNVCSFLIDKH